MKISIFLSYPKPFNSVQQKFIDKITEYLNGRGLAPRTLGVTDYDMDAPLKAIRRLMLESNGLITIAFRRTVIKEGIVKPDTGVSENGEQHLANTWLTSPYCQIEPAMAYQIGMPVLILREKGVVAEGILEKGVTGFYMPEFDLVKPIEGYFSSLEWTDIIGKWEGYVRSVVERKGNPPQLF